MHTLIDSTPMIFFFFCCTQVFQIIWLSNLLGLMIHEACRSHFIGHLHLYYYHWVDTSAGGLIVPESIIRPVVSVSALT